MTLTLSTTRALKMLFCSTLWLSLMTVNHYMTKNSECIRKRRQQAPIICEILGPLGQQILMSPTHLGDEALNRTRCSDNRGYIIIPL